MARAISAAPYDKDEEPTQFAHFGLGPLTAVPSVQHHFNFDPTPAAGSGNARSPLPCRFTSVMQSLADFIGARANANANANAPFADDGSGIDGGPVRQMARWAGAYNRPLFSST